MRVKLIYFLKGFFLLLICFIFVNFITYILRDKQNAEYIYPFYEEPSDTIDVIFVGSSHMYRSVYPLEIWNTYGITSWNLGSSEQSIAASYYLMKEAIERQHPKVIVMEMYMSFVDSKYYSYPRIHQITDNMPLSLNKMELINDLIPFKDRLEFYFPICKYHERWEELTTKDFQKIKRDSKGVEYGGEIFPYPDFEILDKSQKAKVPDITREYIEKAKQLCDENGIKLVLLTVPYLATNEYKYRQEILNGIYDIANNLDIPYINMFHEIENVGFNYKTDFAEWQHLNINGAKKVSTFLGRYLVENYDFNDHADNRQLSELWNKSYENSLIQQENAKKAAQTN